MIPGTVLRNTAVVLDAGRYRAGDGLVESWIVLCVIPNRQHDAFATWVVRTDNGDAMWGHYAESLAEAQEDFTERCQGAARVDRIVA